MMPLQRQALGVMARLLVLVVLLLLVRVSIGMVVLLLLVQVPIGVVALLEKANLRVRYSDIVEDLVALLKEANPRVRHLDVVEDLHVVDLHITHPL